MITAKIIKAGYGYKPGQIVKLTEQNWSLLSAFGFAENYVEPKIKQPIETQMVSQPEIRIVPIEQPVTFFKRRGRPKK